MPTIDVTTNNIGTGINKILKVQLEMFKDALVHVLKSEFVDDYITQFSLTYDSLLVAPYEGKMSANDKTAPSRLKSAVMAYVRSEVITKVGLLRAKQKVMSVQAIEHNIFGFPTGPSKGETDPLKLFYFYLQGTPQEFAFVSVDFLDAWRAGRNLIDFPTKAKRGGGSTHLGRFSSGFMVPLDEYKAVFKVAVGLPSPGQARHPFSGAPPIRIFEEVRSRINFNAYVEKAVVLMRKS